MHQRLTHSTSTSQALSTLRRAVLVAIAAALVATPASAQYLEVPTFGVTTPAGWRSESSDVAVGRDGSVILVWNQFEEGRSGPLPRALAIQHFAAGVSRITLPPRGEYGSRRRFEAGVAAGQ